MESTSKSDSQSRRPNWRLLIVWTIVLLSVFGASTGLVTARQIRIERQTGELQQAVLEHVFAMRPVLTPEQYDRLIQLTAHALGDAPELR